MDRILVVTDSQCYPWNALARAIELAKRIKARVFILKLLSSEERENGVVENDMKTPAGRRLENMINAAREDSVSIEYLVTKGDFKEEVTGFIQRNRITILVMEQGNWGSRKSGYMDFFKEIVFRVSCRVELVSPRRD